MTEADEADNSEDSDTSTDGDSTPADNVTGADQNADTSNETTADSDEELIEESKPVEDISEENKVTGSTIDAAEVTEAGVTVKTLVDEEEEQEDGSTKTVLAEGSSSDVDITFTNGCVNDGKLVKDKNLTFKIEPGAGRVLVKWGYILSDAKSQEPTESTLSSAAVAGKEEMISNSTLVSKDKVKSVTIFVKTAPAGYKVTFANGEGGALAETTLKIYEVVAEGTDEGKLKVATVTTTAGITIPQGESKNFALELVDESKLLDEDGIKLNGQTVEFDDLAEYAKVGDPAEATKTKAYPFTVDPSAYGLDSNAASTAAEVQITVRGAYALAVENLSVTNATRKEHSGEDTANEKFVKAAVADGAFTVTDLKEGYEDYEKTKLAFAVLPDENYVIKSVTAKVKNAGDAGEGVEVEVSDPHVIDTGDDEGTHEYTIDLDQDELVLNANKTLTITIKTEVDDDDENTGVHKITFAAMDDTSDLNNVTITGTPNGGSGETITNAAEKTVRTLADSYTIKVEAKDGYELVKGIKGENGNLEEDEAALENKAFITITETRKYDDVENTVPVERKAEAAAAGVEIDFTKNSTGDKNYPGGDADGADAKAYTVLSAVVKVGVSIEKNGEEKLIAFDNKLKDAGAVVAITNPTGVYKDQYPAEAYDALKDDTYTVADSVDLLTFTVTSATAKPKVTLNVYSEDASDFVTSDLEGVTTEGSNVYTYSVPANILPADTTNANTIIIDKEVGDPQTVKVKVDKVVNIASLKSNVESAVNDTLETSKLVTDNTEATLTAAPKVGQKIKLVFTARKNVTFGEITCQMGETTVPVTIGTDNVSGQATATIETTVTDAITVDVKTAAPYYVVLSGAGVDEADGVYSADYDAKDIVVELKSAETNVAEAFYDIAVKDGGATAVTTAELVGDKTTAKIAEIKPAEWGKTLTIEVQRTKNKEDKYMATLVVSASSDEVTVTDVATNAAVPESGITVMRDDSFKLRVTPKAGANVNDLKLMLCDATGKKDTKAEALFVGGAALELDRNNEVELQAVAAAAAYDGDVYLGVFNSKNGANGKPQTDPLKGGLIKIKVADPVVLSADIAEVQVTSGDASNKDSNKSIGVNMNVGLASKNAKIKMPLDNDLYYKVEVTDITGNVTEGDLKTYKTLTEYIRIEQNGVGGYYDAAEFAKYREFNLVESYKPAGAKAAITSEEVEAFGNLNIPGTISASVKVTLVQAVTGAPLGENPDAKSYVAGKDGSMSMATKLPIYETKLSITKMNGATVFTGQRAVVAVPKFTATTSKNDVYAELINAKTGKVIEDNYGEWEGISTWVDSAGNVVVEADSDVCPKDLQTSDDATIKDNFKNLAVKITASVPVTADEKNDDMYSGYAATAVLKIKVQQGIYNIDAEQGKAALSETLYQDARGAVKSVKITPRYNYGYSNEKPAKAKVTWAITGFEGAPISTLDQHMQDAVTGKKPLITVKNGTISVNKLYKRAATKTNPDADTFYVTATADDFTTGDIAKEDYDSPRRCTWMFTISGENQTIGSLVVVDDDDKPLDAAALKAEDFKNGNLYVAAVKTGAELDKVSGTYDSADYIPVTFKASGKSIKLSGNAATYRVIEFLKPGTAKITATTVDGGKGAGTKATLDLTVAAYAQMGLKLTSADGIETEADMTTVSYYGGSNARYTMYLQYYDAATKTWQNETDYKNVKVAVKGGKFIANKNWSKNTWGDTADMGYAVVVTDKKGVATITLTDTVTKKTLATYTITNNSNMMGVKAPTVKLAKIVDTDGNVQRKVDRNSRYLTFQVTTSDKKLENYAGKYIKLTPDFTVDSTKNAAYSWLRNTGEIYGKIEKIDENGQFTRYLGSVKGNYAYKMVATVGDIKDGEFVAAAKDAKVSFNVSNKKYNDNLKIGAKYVLDAQGTPRVPISVTTGYGYHVSEAKNIIKKDKDQTANNHMNNFTTYFQVWDNYYNVGDDDWQLSTLYSKDNYFGYEEKSATIGLRTDLTAEQIKYITGQDPATAKAAKADCEGYITVSNGTYSKDVKISVSFNKKGVSFTATADPVYASTKQVEVPVKIMNGKQEVYVDEVVLDGTSAVVESDKNITVEDGVAVIKTVKDLKAGTYDINLRVQPVDSAYNAGTKDKADDKKAIDKVTLTYGVPVTLKLEVKDLADTKMIDVGKNTKYSLKSLAYDGYEDVDKYVTGNGYQIADKKGDPGYYQVDVPYTLAAANAKLANNTSKDTYVKVDLDETLIKPDSKKPALVQAEIVYDNGDKGVLQIRVAKQFIETCDKMDKKDKPLTGWNKKLTVPVSIQPVNQAGDKGAAQTVTFTLTTPKAPATFAQVQEAIKTAGLDKIQTPKNTNAAGILNGLWSKVNAKLQTIVAADADVYVECKDVTGVKPESGPASTTPSDIMNEGKAVITIAVTDWSKADSEPVNIDMNYNLALDESSGNASTIADAINIKDDWDFTNDTTEKDLLDAVYEIAEVKAILMKRDEDAETYSKKNRKDNISMKVTSFIKVNATTKTGSMTGTGAGSIKATISIIDLVSGDRATANIDSTILTLTNIVSADAAIKAALDDAAILEIFQNCAGEKAAIVTELDKAAKKAVKDISATSSNADVKVEVPEDSVVAVKPIKESGTSGQDGYQAPVTGKLFFKVTLTEGTRVKSFTKTITIVATEGDKYVDLTKAAEKVTTAVKGAKADGTSEADWAKQIDGTLKTAITTVTAAADFAEKTDAQKKTAIKTAIEESLEGGVLDGSAAGIYGYKADVNVSDYKAATKNQDEVVTFTVTVKPAVGDGAGSDITVTDAVLSAKADTKMSVAELKTALDGVTEVTLTNATDAEYTDASTMETAKGKVKTAVETAFKALMPADQAGELKGVEITVDASSATFDTVAGEDEGSGTITAIKGVKVTVKKDTTDVIPEKTYTSISITKSGS